MTKIKKKKKNNLYYCYYKLMDACINIVVCHVLFNVGNNIC